MILITRFLLILFIWCGRPYLTLTIVSDRLRRTGQGFFQLLLNPIAIFVGHYRDAEEDALVAAPAFSFAAPSRTDKWPPDLAGPLAAVIAFQMSC
jgi:hypothetical protein